MDEKISHIKRQGEYFKVELYRVIKNRIIKGLKAKNSYTFDILPEANINNEKADLVVYKVYEWYGKKSSSFSCN